MPGTNRIPDEAGSMTHAKIPEPVNTETNTDWNTGTNEPVQAMPSRRCDNHSGNAWTGLMDTAIPEPVDTEKNEITESVSALGIHHSTPLAEEMVDSISVVHEVVLGSDTLRTR